MDVIQSYQEEEISDEFNDYPLLIKPAQNCGSRGGSVCYNIQEAKLGIQKACKTSTNGKCIIEKYMDGYQDFTAEYFVIEGIPYLVKAGDRYVGSKSDNLDRQAVAIIAPSKHTENYVKHVNSRVINMLTRIGVNNGVLFIQGFVDGDTVRFYDPAYRFPGSLYENNLVSATGVNHMEYAILFALGEKPDITDAVLNRAYQLGGKCAISLFFPARPGVISTFQGLEEIRNLPGIVAVSPKAHVGSVIPNSGDVQQRVAEIALLVDDDKETIENAVLQVQSMFKVLDENGDNMLVSLADPRKFR